MQAVAKQVDNKKVAPRMANLELLRCIAMMMVLVVHYLDKGGILTDLAGEKLGTLGVVAWLLESFCIVCVNLYMIISGYFLCMSSFKLSRLLKLWLQVWTYSVAVGLIAAFSGLMPAGETADTHYFLSLIFPISMNHYWFMTAYTFLYVLLPMLGAGVRRMSKTQMQLALVFLLVVVSLPKSVLPIRLEADGVGMDCLWYVCVFMAAAYIRRFGMKFLENKGRALALYVLACLAIAGETFALHFVYMRTGRLERLLTICYEHNHIWLFLATIGLFMLFLQIKLTGRFAEFIVKVAPHSLAVYLIHENMGIRYAWAYWVGSAQVDSVWKLLVYTPLAVLFVFACCILIEMLRGRLMHGLHLLLMHLGIYRKMLAKLEAVDAAFKVKE